MVIERFRNGAGPIGERFKSNGRMLPEGLTYRDSWVDSEGVRCFQIMETAKPELLDFWLGHWVDLVDFEVIPIQSSSDFWAQQNRDRESDAG